MSLDQPWCIIVNLTTCHERGWRRWESLLEKNSINFIAHLTDSLEQVSHILSTFLASGNTYFLFVGGDGTVHQCGNLLLQLHGEKSQDLTIGVLPCGTGNDWVRSFGVNTKKIMDSLKEKRSAPLHLIKLTWPDGRDRYAFNMVGGALDAAVVDSLLRTRIKIPSSIKYPIALLKTLMNPHTWHGNIRVDGMDYSGDWLTIQAGFGKYCGGGMYVLPHSLPDQAGLLLMRPKSLYRLIVSLTKLYNGKIANQKEAIVSHFSSIEIMHDYNPIPIEADGEFLGYSPVRLQTCYGVIRRLI